MTQLVGLILVGVVLPAAASAQAGVASDAPNRYAALLRDALKLTPSQYDSVNHVYNRYDGRAHELKNWLQAHGEGHETEHPFSDTLALIIRAHDRADTLVSALLTPRQRSSLDSLRRAPHNGPQ